MSLSVKKAGKKTAPNADQKQARKPKQAQAQDIHRSPPHSSEAEQGVLGSMVLAPRDVIPHCIDRINEAYFYIPAHQTIYKVMVELHEANQAIDLITLTQVLRDRKLLDEIGGAAFVTNLYTFVPTAANVNYYLEIVRDKYILRQIIEVSTESVRRAYEEQDEVNVLLDEVEQKVFAIHEGTVTSKIYTSREAAQSAFEAIEKACHNTGQLLGIPTGFADFDIMTNGLQQPDYTIIAGRPSMGKTAFVMNVVECVAVEQNLPVAIFSLEMSAQQLMQRMIACRARIDIQRIMRGHVREKEFAILPVVTGEIRNAPIFIDDERVNITTLAARARKLRSQHRIRLIIIDYLQLLWARGFRPSDRQAEVTFISSSIKALAKALRVPIIVTAQLNRNPEGRTGGKPRMSDLRESGSIEQDADNIGLLHRPEYYAEDDEDRAKLSGEAYLDITKQRNGPVGEIALTFLKEFTRFEDRARPHQQEEMAMQA